ncbi:MAG TPA: DUF29 domain-containing protein [Sulfurihydrogenibium sp.]|uniref:DUF29 domain-containing protein n=1 Tax=Sulfurihydrogenibium sp. (strain YO3AOP1) TaxID=436114 RepID=UPI000172673A|nr:DUF29 domain-containing protein [Sulfurihydrogenibium sp. YO3AOP1]ACD66877.1 protein of unknown function DUF29 [Sulfurihydrogenibium sp. YO3AOP1]HBT98070.1 DUF29 domain-containing protein [Sulfurihydrogenibium sp.]
MGTQIVNKEELKQLYDRDFYLWVMENLELLKNKEFDLVDWENLLEEIEDMGRRYLDSAVSFIAIVLEHLYKYEHFRENENMGNSWINSIDNARVELEWLFKEIPSLKRKAQQEIDSAWYKAVKKLVKWFRKPENYHLAKKYFDKLPTEEDFPKKCPYTFEQILEHEPWLENNT